MQKRFAVGLCIAFGLALFAVSVAFRSSSAVSLSSMAFAFFLFSIAFGIYRDNIEVGGTHFPLADVPLIAGCLAAVLIFSALVLLPAAQAVVWLRKGQWPHWTLANVVAPILGAGTSGNWLAQPHSWYGLHAVVKSLIYDVPLFWWVFGLWLAAVQFVIRASGKIRRA